MTTLFVYSTNTLVRHFFFPSNQNMKFNCEFKRVEKGFSVFRTLTKSKQAAKAPGQASRDKTSETKNDTSHTTRWKNKSSQNTYSKIILIKNQPNRSRGVYETLDPLFKLQSNLQLNILNFSQPWPTVKIEKFGNAVTKAP